MSDRIIKLLGLEETLVADTPTTVSGAHLVRIHAHAEVILTVKDGSGVTTGTCSLHTGETFFLRKLPTDTIQVDGNNSVAVSVAFGD
jgi:hypothetical protein